MDLMLLRIFQLHVLDQCTFMIMSADQVNLGLQTSDVTLVFFGLQNLVNAAANVKKALWGQANDGASATSRKTYVTALG